MKLYSALCHVKFCGDFFIGEILEHAAQHILLAAADLHFAGDGASRSKKLLGPFSCGMKQRRLRDDHNLEVFRRLAAHQAEHCQQARNLFDRQTTIRISVHAKSHGA